MSTLDIIRETGKQVAYEYGIYGQSKCVDISVPNKLAENFIERVEEDLSEFSTLASFADSFNLFLRAFMYVYGKGAEVVYFTRIGCNINHISYDFDKTMKGICGEMLPFFMKFRINQKSDAMLEMYVQMFGCTKGSQETIISEGLDFKKCIRTILSGAFFYGTYICSTIPITDDNFTQRYQNLERDKPFDPDTYDKNYQPQDFRMINIRFGDSGQ